MFIMNKQLYNAVISTPQYMLEGNFHDLEILGGENYDYTQIQDFKNQEIFKGDH